MSAIDLLDRPIAFHRVFVCLTGNVAAALMLAQLLYWSRKSKDPEGWVYKSQAEWTDETGLSRREQDTCRKNLRTTDFYHEELRSVPARLYYRLDLEKLDATLQALPERGDESAKLDCTKPPNKSGAKRQTYKGTETTSEITTETTTPTPPPALSAKSMEVPSARESSGGDCLIRDLIPPKGLSDDERAKALEIVSRLPSAQAQAVLDEMEGAVRSNRIKSNRLGWLRKVAESATQGTFSPELGIRIAEERRVRVQREAQIHAPQPKSWQEELIDQELERKATGARASPARCAGMDARACPGTDGDPVSCSG